MHRHSVDDGNVDEYEKIKIEVRGIDSTTAGFGSARKTNRAHHDGFLVCGKDFHEIWIQRFFDWSRENKTANASR